MMFSSWSFLSLLLVSSPSVGQIIDNLELFWNLYTAVVRGSRILHDVTEGVGAVSKAIRAIDSFLEIPTEGKTINGEPTNDAAEPTEGNKVVTEFPESKDSPGGNWLTQERPEVKDEGLLSNIPGIASPPVFNGCGALGFHIRGENLPVAKMTECCAAHDKCYGASCKVNKRDCDYKLRSCLFSMCDIRTLDKNLQKSCRSAAKILFSGTMALSFQQLNDAQLRQDCKLYERPDKGKRGW